MIARDDVMWRTTHVWYEGTVPYSQSTIHQPDGYRQDCSGYVSMCWMTPTPGGSTVTLVEDGSMYEIGEDALLPGDAIGHCGPGTGGNYGHIQLFEGWDGEGYWVWEQTGGWGQYHNYYSGRPSWYGYKAYRYVGIEEDGMSEREAQLAASYSTTGSDVNGWVAAPEGDSIRTYANRQVEERLNAKLAEIMQALDAVRTRVDELGREHGGGHHGGGHHGGGHRWDEEHPRPRPHWWERERWTSRGETP